MNIKMNNGNYPSNPSFPQSYGVNEDNQNYEIDNNKKGINYQSVKSHESINIPPLGNHLDHSEGLREMREIKPFDNELNEEEMFNYNETFSDKLNTSDLPSLLQEVNTTQEDPEARDKLIFAALALWSGCMPNVSGVYKKKRVTPPIYGLINAPSGAQKGPVEDCRQLVMPIEYELRRQHEQEQAEYERRRTEWIALEAKQKKMVPEPKEPKCRSMLISANSSASIVYEDLQTNGGNGIIFDTEADTMANVLGQEWGQWSDLLRKAFHHEQVSLRRKNENTRIVIDRPNLAVLLTCTPGQIPQLLPANQVENGLANRFLFYCLKGSKGWENPFDEEGDPLEEIMFKIGQRYLTLYHALQQRANSPLEFTLSEEQKVWFNEFFSPLYDEQIGINGEELSAFIFRLGLSTYRIAMALTVLRCADKEPMFEPESQVLVCSDIDFQTALTIANTLINHTCHVYTNILPHQPKPTVAPGIIMPDRQRQLYEDMTDEFTTRQWFNRAVDLGIPKKTAERYLGVFYNKLHLVRRIKNGLYQKNSKGA